VANIAEDAVLFLAYGAVQRCIVTWLKTDVELDCDSASRSLSKPAGYNSIASENRTSFTYSHPTNLATSSQNRAILRLTPFENACAGSVASISCGVILTPIELVKCRMQAMQEKAFIEGRKLKRIGAFQLTAKIIRKEGWTAPFKVTGGRRREGGGGREGYSG
jgi:hypothetical protein